MWNTSTDLDDHADSGMQVGELVAQKKVKNQS